MVRVVVKVEVCGVGSKPFIVTVKVAGAVKAAIGPPLQDPAQITLLLAVSLTILDSEVGVVT
jgi:hypothetical protein